MTATRGSSTTPPTSAKASPALAPDALRQKFEELGLTRYEAAVLVATLQLGSARSSRLAAASGVPRTSAYPVLEDLHARGLVEQMPGTGPVVWLSPGPDEVIDRVIAWAAAEEAERLRQFKERAEKVREALAEAVPEASTEPAPYVHVIRSTARAERSWDQLLDSAEEELVMFTKPPYLYAEPNPKVLDMLERGVAARVLYQADSVDEPDAQEWLEAYHAGGVRGRLVEHLPVKLVVVDRRSAILGTTHPTLEGYPTILLIDHPGVADVLADAFEHRWSKGRPYERPTEPAAEERP